MVKGYEKRMVRLQNPNSRYFEEVCFILKDDPSGGLPKRADLLEEANRILDENRWESPCVGNEKRRQTLSFLLGMVTAASLLLPLFLVL